MRHIKLMERNRNMIKIKESAESFRNDQISLLNNRKRPIRRIQTIIEKFRKIDQLWLKISTCISAQLIQQRSASIERASVLKSLRISSAPSRTYTSI